MAVTPLSPSEFSGFGVAKGRSDGVDLIFGDSADEGRLDRLVKQTRTRDAGFQGTPEQYGTWISAQLQAAHNEVYLARDLQADGDPMGGLKPGFYREISPGVYTEVPEGQATIIVEGDTVTVRATKYDCDWTGSEYGLTQRRL